jgi:hypothetical protein
LRDAESEIGRLVDIEEGQKAEVNESNGWVAWFLSPLLPRSTESEEEIEQKEMHRARRLEQILIMKKERDIKASELNEAERVLLWK